MKRRNFTYKDYSHQFVENPQNKRISAAEGRIVDNLLLEKISLAGIARAGINLKKMSSGSMLKKLNEVKKSVQYIQ